MIQALTELDVAIAGSLLCLIAALTALLRLGVAQQILISGARMVVQLYLMAYVLRWLFGLQTPSAVFIALVVMGLFAGLEVILRQSAVTARVWTGATASLIILAAGLLVSLPALAFIVGSTPWYAPQVALPLFGMVAGSAMTAVALTWTTFAEAAHRDRDMIEAQLTLGATSREALGSTLRHSARTGLLPVINSMGAIGLVHFPGVMTGQLLAGADPVQAVKYQLLVMFAIAAATGLSVTVAAYAIAARVTDSRHRLRLDRLKGAGT